MQFIAWQQWEDHCYKAFQDSRANHSEAQDLCHENAAQLVSWDDEEEYIFIRDYLAGLPRAGNQPAMPEGHPPTELWWTGGRRVDDIWVWEDRKDDCGAGKIWSKYYNNTMYMPTQLNVLLCNFLQIRKLKILFTIV